MNSIHDDRSRDELVTTSTWVSLHLVAGVLVALATLLPLRSANDSATNDRDDRQSQILVNSVPSEPKAVPPVRLKRPDQQTDTDASQQNQKPPADPLLTPNPIEQEPRPVSEMGTTQRERVAVAFSQLREKHGVTLSLQPQSMQVLKCLGHKYRLQGIDNSIRVFDDRGLPIQPTGSFQIPLASAQLPVQVHDAFVRNTARNPKAAWLILNTDVEVEMNRSLFVFLRSKGMQQLPEGREFRAVVSTSGAKLVFGWSEFLTGAGR